MVLRWPKMTSSLRLLKSKFFQSIFFFRPIIMAKPGPDKDVHISLEDQQKINKFARHNNRLEDIKDDMKQKEAELVTLGDATNDVEEFSLTGNLILFNIYFIY